MATYSTVMGLKLNDPSDSFELSDFVANWETIDASPGTYICTSNTRPNWGAACRCARACPTLLSGRFHGATSGTATSP